jgi:hypothetical protein
MQVIGFGLRYAARDSARQTNSITGVWPPAPRCSLQLIGREEAWGERWSAVRIIMYNSKNKMC